MEGLAEEEALAKCPGGRNQSEQSGICRKAGVLGVQRARVGTEIKLWPLGQPHAHFLYTFLFCYASSKFYPSSTEYFV